MFSEKLLSRHSLENGLTLEFWDHSRPVAGDRWQVALEARVTIPVTDANLTPDLRPSLAEVVKALGSEIIFSQKEVRNFIADIEVADLIKQIEMELLSSLSSYLGHPDFGARFIRKKYHEFLEKQSWYRK